ncbi:hypothetical protein BV25DRAFT_1841341 [Artomyces pyxidatus]|uniref:Uncharacterized protein n=1 Tax=Artomyces pyxidatus TaxID=48021 RepID=A0ACB8SQ49_9AGAM|nr:hypothetical protein BV25DRAFT_1841341 [Artomyces pyxidatus]
MIRMNEQTFKSSTMCTWDPKLWTHSQMLKNSSEPKATTEQSVESSKYNGMTHRSTASECDILFLTYPESTFVGVKIPSMWIWQASDRQGHRIPGVTRQNLPVPTPFDLETFCRCQQHILAIERAVALHPGNVLDPTYIAYILRGSSSRSGGETGSSTLEDGDPVAEQGPSRSVTQTEAQRPARTRKVRRHPPCARCKRKDLKCIGITKQDSACDNCQKAEQQCSHSKGAVDARQPKSRLSLAFGQFLSPSSSVKADRRSDPIRKQSADKDREKGSRSARQSSRMSDTKAQAGRREGETQVIHGSYQDLHRSE